MRSLWIGCLLAVLAPGVCLIAYLLATGTGLGNVRELVVGALGVLALACLVSAMPMLLLGLPYILWLRSRGALSWLNVCLGASVIGAATMAVLRWGMVWNNPAPGVWSYVVGAGLGLAAGLGFCIGARPNYSFKPTPLRGAA